MKVTIGDALKKIPIFGKYDSDEIKILSKFMNLVKVGKGNVLFKEGDEGDFICFVSDGRLDVIKTMPREEEIILNTLSRGQSFGEMSIIENSPRSATVKADTDAVLITLTKNDFEKIVAEHTQLGTKILKAISLLLSRKLRTTSSRLIDYMSTSP